MAASYIPDRNGDALSPVAGEPGGRSTALSSRITSILATSCADLEIRNALETLDKQHFQNTQDSRRQLRLDLQQDVIQCNGEIIRDFGQVAEQLKRIGSVVSSLNSSCAHMRAQIEAARREAGPVLKDADAMMAERRHVESKQQLLAAFRKHFVISDEEAAALTSSTEPVDDEFFRVLAKVKGIHRDSEVLLGTENERLGLEILDQSSKQLNAAFQKVYRWIQKEFKHLDLENPQIGSSIRRSLRALAERPALFQSCMDFFVEAREHTLSDAFHGALTGASGPNAKPIEFHSHDPLRYIGDMLAWAHSATVSEREALEVLFVAEGDQLAKGIKAGIDSDPWSREHVPEETFDGRKALNELVSRDIAGVARLLRQRTEQVISCHEDATLAYNIANLISFYSITFQKLLGPDASILETLATLEASAQRQFRANMKDHIASIRADLTAAPADLSPPEFLDEALATLKALMKSYDTSLAAVDDRQDAFQSVLAEALDPFMEACESIYKKMAKPSSDIFAINCLLAAREALRPYSFTSDRISEIDEIIEEHGTNLVDQQYHFLLTSSGLEALVVELSSLSDSTDDLRRIPALELFQESSLISISQTLDDFLPSAIMDATENIRRLRTPRLIREITEASAERFCNDFDMVERRLMAADDLVQHGEDEEEMPPRLRDLFPRTSEEIRVLLS
ncbi:oligomeric complex COG6 [Trichodelitschia bisporula]|uniref:Conserved oligomeric Golgi complex subunit 6 n=1 Tax=Trichodelitschia bisporula TaxID=703511 RepID=A0A6G1I2H5_9PEZI|nr:oligomeric complex COG6 [Trichodelitschia bisporula]